MNGGASGSISYDAEVLIKLGEGGRSGPTLEIHNSVCPEFCPDFDVEGCLGQEAGSYGNPEVELANLL